MLPKLDFNHLANWIRIIWNSCPTASNDAGISSSLLFGPFEIPRSHITRQSTGFFPPQLLLIKMAKPLRLQGYDALYNARMTSTNPKYPLFSELCPWRQLEQQKRQDVSSSMVLFLVSASRSRANYHMHTMGQPRCVLEHTHARSEFKKGTIKQTYPRTHLT